MGCNGPQEAKYTYCKTCGIAACAKRRALPDPFCDRCPDYPCADILEKEIRYANAYPLVESPIGNLALLRQKGMPALLRAEQARWRCPACGGVLCVHTGLCAGCGKAYSVRPPAGTRPGEKPERG